MILITLDRIKRVVFLDEKVYSEIAEDKDALVQAIIVVLLTMVIGEIGNVIESIISNRGFYSIEILILIFSISCSFCSSSTGFYLILILILSLAGWFIVTGIMHIVAKLLGGKADFVSYLKAIGFARVPGMLVVIPHIGWIIGPIWVFACYFTATKVVHRLSTGKAIIAAVIVPITLMVLIIWRNIMIYFSLASGTLGDIVLAYAIGVLTLLLLFSLL